MSHYVEERHLIHSHQAYQSKPLNMETKIQENKGSFCIDALLSKNEERPPTSPDNTSRSISPSSSTRSRSSPPISPGSEEIIPPNNSFIPRPGLLSHIYPNTGTFYGYQTQPQSSAFHHLDGTTMVQKVQLPVNHHGQLQQMHLEWFARTGMFYPRLPDLTGKCLSENKLYYQI